MLYIYTSPPHDHPLLVLLVWHKSVPNIMMNTVGGWKASLRIPHDGVRECKQSSPQMSSCIVLPSGWSLAPSSEARSGVLFSVDRVGALFSCGTLSSLIGQLNALCFTHFVSLPRPPHNLYWIVSVKAVPSWVNGNGLLSLPCWPGTINLNK